MLHFVSIHNYNEVIESYLGDIIMNILGYINKLIYTDIDAYKVFEENGKVEAVAGGFCRVVLNNSELYADPNCEIICMAVSLSKI